MDAEQFLARTVAPGNYVCIAYQFSRGGLKQKFYERTALKEAAGYGRWVAQRGADVWYAVASLQTDQDRTQANVQAVRCIWYDADIKRAGDGKADDRVYADVPDLARWLKHFTDTTTLPRPNLWVNSGYGMHLYWVMEDALDPQTWQVYASAFKAALVAAGAKGDIGVTGDSARILRLPDTNNLKVRTSPQPVVVLSQLTRGDYPNDLILQALQPYVSAQPNYGSGLAGAPPKIANVNTSTLAAAQANMPSRREHLFSEIATKCEQVKRSLTTGGKGDSYSLWYLGHLSLAHFCSDGQAYAHEISKGDPRYSPSNVDTHVQRIAAEQARKQTGAPTCSSYNIYQPGVCNACPHWGRLVSPYTLGVEDGDLPDGYRRHAGRIQRIIYPKPDEPSWVDVMVGDVYGPALDRLGNDRELTFTYNRAGIASGVTVRQSHVPFDIKAAQAIFGPQGVTLNRNTAEPWSKFIVAWIEKLRDLRAERSELILPFGWATKTDEASTYIGFAVGGTLYRTSGAQEPAPGGDGKLLEWFTPRGSLTKWRAAFDLVAKDRPDLQVLIAGAFAAPLIEFTGLSGVVISGWSTDSAVGKSSALQVGAAVWGSPLTLFHHDDTINNIFYRIGKTRVMPAYWDEARIKKDEEDAFVNMLFRLGQGREKGRLNADASLKDSGDWKTAVMMTGNRRLMEYVLRERGDTDAGAVRLFEFQIRHPQLSYDAAAAATIGQVQKHYGHAGRAYAEWLAKNITPARALVQQTQTNFQGKLNAMQNERFFVATVACLIVGAFIANSLGLTTFDTAAMWSFLETTFNQLRAERVSNLPIGAGTFDIAAIFGAFVSDHTNRRLLTKRFARPGPKNRARSEILWAPRRDDRLAIHIAVDDRRMRIDKSVLEGWCFKKNYSSLEVISSMEGRWGALRRRGLIGAGTDYVSGKIDFIEVPLTSPELELYIDDTKDDV